MPPAPDATNLTVDDASHINRMGSLLDLNESSMLAFGSTGFHQRPPAGIPRRCIDQDDLDGINFLFPTCGLQLTLPPCEYVSDGINSFVGLRLLETWIKLMILPILVIMGSKLLSLAVLGAEDAFATWRVRRQARKLLEEAQDAAAKAREANGEAPESPSRRGILARLSPTRKRSGGAKSGGGFMMSRFGRGKEAASTVQPEAQGSSAEDEDDGAGAGAPSRARVQTPRDGD